MKLKFNLFLNIGLLFFLMFTSCNQNNNTTSGNDTFTGGTYSFAFDETISPLLDQELYVYKSIFEDANPKIVYKSENKILDLILNDKARFAVMCRTLKTDEVKLLTDRNLPPKIGKVAEDAIALIVNKQSTDTLMSLYDVKGLFNNKSNNKNLIFDNSNSSIINYLKNLSGVKQLNQKNIYALNNNKEVIKYISTHNNAIGFISFSWLIEPDSDYLDAVKGIKVVAIKDDKKFNGAYFKPSQTSLALKQYPLIRTVYIVDCTGKIGLGAGFASFLQSERGQKIVLRSGLLPDSMPRRDINIKKEF